MDVESVAAWFRVVAHSRVAQQAFAKSTNDILAYAQMCSMEDWHGGHLLAVLHAECSWPPLPVASTFSNCIACRTSGRPAGLIVKPLRFALARVPAGRRRR
jgi:hypothetical protein